MLLTDRKVRALQPGEKIADAAPRGAGRLVAWRKGEVIEFYFRSRRAGQDIWQKLGNFGDITLAEARERVRVLGRGQSDVVARGTVEDVLAGYVEWQRAAGKNHRNVETTLLRAIPKGDAFRRRRASEVRPAEIAAVIGRRLSQGVTTEANRLRSCLSAAFGRAARADNDPRGGALNGVRFGLTANPVAMVPTIREYERTSERALSWAELGSYWRALESESPVIAASLRFILAIGHQRIAQVVRVPPADIDGVLRMVDGKGRGEARPHAVPLTPFARKQLEAVKAYGRWPTIYTLGHAVARAAVRVGGEPFDARDLRRSVESRLGDAGISREVLSHLLSHGRSGVQERSYDRAERLELKANALKVWERGLRRAIAAPAKAPGKPVETAKPESRRTPFVPRHREEVKATLTI